MQATLTFTRLQQSASSGAAARACPAHEHAPSNSTGPGLKSAGTPTLPLLPHPPLPSDHGSGGEAGGERPAAFLGEAAGVVLLLRHASSTLRAGGGGGAGRVRIVPRQ